MTSPGCSDDIREEAILRVAARAEVGGRTPRCGGRYPGRPFGSIACLQHGYEKLRPGLMTRRSLLVRSRMRAYAAIVRVEPEAGRRGSGRADSARPRRCLRACKLDAHVSIARGIGAATCAAPAAGRSGRAAWPTTASLFGAERQHGQERRAPSRGARRARGRLVTGRWRRPALSTFEQQRPRARCGWPSSDRFLVNEEELLRRLRQLEAFRSGSGRLVPRCDGSSRLGQRDHDLAVFVRELPAGLRSDNGAGSQRRLAAVMPTARMTAQGGGFSDAGLYGRRRAKGRCRNTDPVGVALSLAVISSGRVPAADRRSG